MGLTVVMQAPDIEIVNFILGNRCNSKCGHCFSNSTPESKAKLDESVAVEYANLIRDSDLIKEVHFNGGEPLLYSSTLKKMIDIVNAKHPKIIKLATGAGEFQTVEITRDLLTSIQKIDEIWISIDTYHLEHISLQNYKNFNEVVQTMNVKIIYSISYKNIQEYAQTLRLIQNEKFSHYKITKQPVSSFGRATKIKDLTAYLGHEIPEDYKCFERNIATVWPSGRVTNCSAYAGRSGYAQQHSDLETFIKNNLEDQFFIERTSKTFREMAERRGLSGPFNLTSPCETCKSILNQSQMKTKAV